MAVFPSGNPGVAPVDTETSVGQLRLILGDTAYTLYIPDEPGFADFTMYSDAELEVFLVQGSDSVLRAAGFAYLALSAQAATTGSSIKDYDLAVDTKNRAADLRATAQFYFDAADSGDLGSDDAFIITPTGTQDCWPPELSEWPVCACRRSPCTCGGW